MFDQIVKRLLLAFTILFCFVLFCPYQLSNSYSSLAQVPPAPAPFGRFIETINGIPLELVRIPTGKFLMGNNASPYPEEKPAREVNVKSVYISQFEITRAQWNIVATTLPSVNRPLSSQYLGPVQAGAGNYSGVTPADELSWEQAVEFCDRLSRLTSKKYRLPSEAEWEYACRAGTSSEYSFGEQFNSQYANMGLGPNYLLDIGKLGYANNWGLYEMHGNAGEWCLDDQHLSYAGAPSDGTAWLEGGSNRNKVLRGGWYRSIVEVGRSSARSFFPKNLIVTKFGFRVVAEITPTIGTGQVTATSAASYSGLHLATESIAALFGGNLSNVTQTASVLPLPFTLAGASVNLKDSSGNEYLAPLFFASSGQINFLIPPGLAPGRGTVSVVTNGVIHSTGPLEIARVNPGLFAANATGKDAAAALVLRVRSNGEQVYEPVATFDTSLNRFVPLAINLSDPAEQVFLILFGTGFKNRSSLSNALATIGGLSAEVLFAGAQGDLVGLDQCNLRLPPSLAGRGEVNVSLTVDGITSNTVQIRVK